ncbi:unannotated protein [freshwater metagenome]|uniref:Unannotated protein n=1 Tax=freshwater metagenome TaxID=449393 RepID=A0A6J6NU92_9ZZZZ
MINSFSAAKFFKKTVSPSKLDVSTGEPLSVAEIIDRPQASMKVE